ncbi:hypothetical protein D3C76_1877560 [compost metagenome]
MVVGTYNASGGIEYSRTENLSWMDDCGIKSAKTDLFASNESILDVQVKAVEKFLVAECKFATE